MRAITLRAPNGDSGATLVITNEDLVRLLDGKACVIDGGALGAPHVLSVAVAYVPTHDDVAGVIERLHALIVRGMDAVKSAQADTPVATARLN